MYLFIQATSISSFSILNFCATFSPPLHLQTESAANVTDIELLNFYVKWLIYNFARFFIVQNSNIPTKDLDILKKNLSICILIQINNLAEPSECFLVSYYDIWEDLLNGGHSACGDGVSLGKAWL